MTKETLEGYVVDIACLRKYPRSEWYRRAKEHTKKCCLMGHCVESGYGLVDQNNQLSLFDTHATPLVVEVLQSCPQEGIWLKGVRQQEEKEMVTQSVELGTAPAD